MSDKAPTDEQAAILDLVVKTSSNISIKAFAGTGKTTMLRMLSNCAKEQPILYLAFGRRMVDEAIAEGSFPGYVDITTLNGQGHRIWARTINVKPVPDKQKTGKIFKEIIGTMDSGTRSLAWEGYWEVVAGVELAKAIGYVPSKHGFMPAANRLVTTDHFISRLEEKPSELVMELIDAVLIRSIKAAYNGNIDFNDQVYMPALFTAVFPRFPLILVDETQDLNPTNHALVDKLAKGRVVSVGDDCQSIFQFRGAMMGGMARLAQRYKMEERTLSLSFRCPQAVVEEARWRVPEFRWVKPGGVVQHLDKFELHGFQEEEWNGEECVKSVAIVCRNNAPLFKLAFQLLNARRSVQVAGSDIGPKLVGTLQRLGGENVPRDTVFELIDIWLEEKKAKGSTTSDDMAEAMRVFASQGKTLGQAVSYAKNLFSQQGRIKLLTGHKAKGLEFDVVYFLDPWLIKDGEEQEDNLRYVMQTRAKRELHYLDTRNLT